MTVWYLLAGLAFAQCFVVGLLLVPVARTIGPRLGLVDAPTLERKIHSAPTPRSGGLAIFAAFWGCLAVNAALALWVVPSLEWIPANVRTLAANVTHPLPRLAAIFAGCAIIFVLGFIDDRRGLSPRVRLVVQVLATIPLMIAGVHLNLFMPAPIGMALTILWLVLLTNSFNFLDNMNGLTSGVAVIIACMLALVSALSREWFMMLVFAMLAGAALAFWRYNFFGGSIFLGDSGSTHLGFLFAALTVVATYWEVGVPTKLPVLMPGLVLAVPLFDTLSVMWIRWRTGRPLMEGDTNHLSHRLVALGFSRREAVVVIYGFTLCVGLAAVALRQLDWRHGLVQTVMIGMLFAIVHRIERVSRRARMRDEG